MCNGKISKKCHIVERRRVCSTLLGFTTAMVCFLPCYGIADQTATTEKGEKVILFDNGTWKLASEQDLVTIKMSQPAKKEVDPFAQQTKHEDGSVSYIDVIRKTSAFDFRQATWGMNKTQIKSSEKLKIVKEVGDTLVYEYSMMGMKSLIQYVFVENKFAVGQYSIEQEHVNPAQFSEDYDNLKQYLRGMYGSPISDQDVWKNDNYKSDPSQWGFAVSIGFLTRFVIWKGSTAKINLQMNGENHRIFTTIKFSALKS